MAHTIEELMKFAEKVDCEDGQALLVVASDKDNVYGSVQGHSADVCAMLVQTFERKKLNKIVARSAAIALGRKITEE